MIVGWWSQPFAPEGSAAGEGIVKQLGMPSLDPLAVLVREAAQNSWDARLDGGPIEFGLRLWRLDDEMAAQWRLHLLPPPDSRAAIPLNSALSPGSLVLVVSDRHTVGLGGPLRAGHRAPSGERSDFVQFMRNIGEPNDQQFGGGTYGFGKGIYYRISRASTILVDTRTHEGGSNARRLMGSSLGSSWFDGSDRRYTGRHWWGAIVDDVPDPLLDDDASSVAVDLGLPGFEDGQSGTDVVVLSPDLGFNRGEDAMAPRTSRDAAEFMISSLLWHLWPKMIPDLEGRHMRFTVEVDGEVLRIPDPADVPELLPFVSALHRIRRGEGSPYRRTVAPREAGLFALETDAAQAGPTDIVIDAARPFDGPARHVARMRTAELVVDYLEGMPHPNPLLCYGAVFKSTEEADEYFATAEPPTHDAWIETGLTGTTRGVVQRARLFIHKQLESAFASKVPSSEDSTASLGELATRLAGLVPRFGDHPRPGDVDVSATDVREGRAGSGPGPTPRLVGSPILRLESDRPILLARVLIRASNTERAVAAETHIVVDGGSKEQLPPIGETTSSVLGWSRTPDRTLEVEGNVLCLPPGPDVEWWVLATYVSDAVVAFKVRTAPGRHHAG